MNNWLVAIYLLVRAVGSSPTCLGVLSAQGNEISLQEVDCSQSHVVSGSFNDTIATTGWSFLDISTDSSYPDEVQAYAAGYLEGKLTNQRTYEYMYNVQNLSTNFGPDLTQFLEENTNWILGEAKKRSHEAYWHQVGLMLAQFDGFVAGYSASAPQHQAIPRAVLWAAQFIGDSDDLCEFMECYGNIHEWTGDSHCSVLIKLLPDFADLIMGHTTWSAFETMTRIYKSYSFGYHRTAVDKAKVHNTQIAFSGYPGLAFSMDDWYELSGGLVVTETTIANKNASLWANVQPIGQLPYWLRVMVANRLSRSGPEWMNYFFEYNSGTYNNQWMVVDLSKFHPGQGLEPDALWVAEQLPGYYEKADMTNWLIENGNWVSYNRPFFPFIFNISDQPAWVAKYGDHYSWSKTARAVLFSELQPSVVNLSTYELVLRHNNYLADAIGTQGCATGRSGSNAIAERGDLTLPAANCIPDIAQIDECSTDAKYTSALLLAQGGLTAVIQSGPPRNPLPPFVWSNSVWADRPHIGQPDEWAFDWVTVSFPLTTNS